MRKIEENNISYYRHYIKLLEQEQPNPNILKILSEHYPNIRQDSKLLTVAEIEEKIKLLTSSSRVPITYNGQVHIEHQTINKLNIRSFNDLVSKFTS